MDSVSRYVADAFFHPGRVEERSGPRDPHGRLPSSASCLDPLDPPLERLRARLGSGPARRRGARFALALTHGVDVPWRWTCVGVFGGTARPEAAVSARKGPAVVGEACSPAAAHVRRLGRTDRLIEGIGARGGVCVTAGELAAEARAWLR